MMLRLIKNERQYKKVMAEIEGLMDAPARGPKADRLDVLVLLADVYENEHHRIDPPDPIDAILFRMEQGGHTRENLGDLLGVRSGRVSELLRGKRALTVDMIRTLHEKWEIPLKSLIRPAKERPTGKRGRKPRRITQEARAGKAGAATTGVPELVK